MLGVCAVSSGTAGPVDVSMTACPPTDGFVRPHRGLLPFAQCTNRAKDQPVTKALNGRRWRAVEVLLQVWPDGARIQDTTAKYPMHYAVMQEQPKALRFLLAAWPEGIHAGDVLNATPVHHAVHFPSMLPILLAACPEGSQDVDLRGCTPMHRAVQYNQPTSLRCLLEVWPQGVTVPNGVGESAMAIARRLNHRECLSMLEATFQQVVLPSRRRDPAL